MKSTTTRAALLLAIVGVVVALVVVLTRTGSSSSSSAEGLAGLAASAGVSEVLGLRPGDRVTVVEGEPVVGAEVLRAADTVRAEVISEFTGDGAALGPGFWDRARAGVTPRAALRDRAVRAAVLDKVRRVWAREAGLLADVSEQGFQRELAAENLRRAQAAREGRPLPGVPSYDEHTYARVRAAELDSALSKIHAAGLDLSERRLREQYERMAGKDAPPFEQARDNVRHALVAQEYLKALRARAG
ncbi:hypothetical protein ACFXJ8_16955 [Nonomuraea sp. NPDC059194]|uniref:hypothetical protein n=1 Tax=Nonomuraea sp. NPDC059194 TaxID=3346764 RepID=UPI00367F2D8F